MVELSYNEHKKRRSKLNPVELHDYRFATQMGCDLDLWCLGGRVYGHPNYRDGSHVFVSTPKAFDRLNSLLMTASGREYRLVNPAGNAEDTWDEIEFTIERGGYKSW